MFERPPYEFKWIKSVSDEVRQQLQRFVLSSEFTLRKLRGATWYTTLKLQNEDYLLALRGLLAHRHLVHCLMRRHRVNYGIKRVNGIKRMAVPFLAHDTPSDRSEFGHPDTAIVYTVLSYYYDGLTDEQVKQGFNTLFRRGPSERRTIYERWFSTLDDTVSELESTNDVDKIDLSNDKIKKLVLHYYRFNRYMINFWLNSCVFPVDMKQYSHKPYPTRGEAQRRRKERKGREGKGKEKNISSYTVPYPVLSTIPRKRVSQ
jgi:hypothetical protein